MAITVPGITLSSEKGAALTHDEVDANFKNLRNACNSLFAMFLTPFNPDGTLRAGAISNINMFTDAVISQFLDLTFQLGDFILSGRTTAPNAKWLAMDGSAISRTTYADWYAICADMFGAGNGTTTFNLPNAPGRTIVCSGTGNGLTVRALADVWGTENVALVFANMAKHYHGFGSVLAGMNDDAEWLVRDWALADNGTTAAHAIAGQNNSYVPQSEPALEIGTLGTTNQVNIEMPDDGPGSDHANTQPSLAMNMFIKVLS